MTVPAALRFTYQDYVLLADDRRYEVVDGELLLTPAPTVFHQVVKGRLKRLLDDFVSSAGLGVVLDAPCDVVLSDADVLQPDILFVSEARRPLLAERFVAGAPDLVIEVLSPSTEGRDRIAKAKQYARFGVRELWIADPAAKTIEVHTGSPEGFRLVSVSHEDEPVRSIVLAGLEFSAAPIFRPA